MPIHWGKYLKVIKQTPVKKEPSQIVQGVGTGNFKKIFKFKV